MTKLLVATGYAYSSGTLQSVEVVNLDESNPNLICDNLPDFPIGMIRAIGHLYAKTTPIVCGGAWTSDCFTFYHGNWMFSSSLNERRIHTASAIFSNSSNEEDDIILITGGLNVNDAFSPLSSVESFDGKIWNQIIFASLPTTLYSHCMVKIDNSLLFLIGGVIENTPDASSNTYFFDVLNNQWISGPQLNIKRYEHSCGVIHWTNPNNGIAQAVVVVAGGINTKGNAISSVELLFLDEYKTNKQGWTLGPNLPQSIYAAKMTEFQDRLILVGGIGNFETDNRRLYQLSTTHDGGPWFWTELKQILKEGRNSAVSFLIPDEIVNCH